MTQNYSKNELRFLIWMLVTLAVIVVASTILHHIYPYVLKVPPNEGIPMSSMSEMFSSDILVILLTLPCFIHSMKRLGPYKTAMFFGGSFVFTGVEESMWILAGRFPPLNEFGTYYFTKGGMWFFETPLTACLGWYFLAYGCRHIAEVISKRGTYFKAALAGFIAMDIDLWVDPLATHEKIKSWIWVTKEHIRIFSIPVTNFIGWFLLIFLFAIFFEKIDGLRNRHSMNKAGIIFFAWLMLANLVILLGFGIIGSIFSLLPPINLTVGGI